MKYAKIILNNILGNSRNLQFYTIRVFTEKFVIKNRIRSRDGYMLLQGKLYAFSDIYQSQFFQFEPKEIHLFFQQRNPYRPYSLFFSKRSQNFFHPPWVFNFTQFNNARRDVPFSMATNSNAVLGIYQLYKFQRFI